MTVEFRPDGQATEVVITHERLPKDAVSAHAAGWTDILESLAKNFTPDSHATK